MKIQIASDLHLEHIEDEDVDFSDILNPSADVLALCGDIITYDSPLLQPFLEWCSSNFTFVLWVPGNHEYYTCDSLSYNELNLLYSYICSHFSNVFFMNKRSILVNNVLFIGCTLWSRIPGTHATQIESVLRDYRYIYTMSGERLTVEEVNHLFDHHFTYICKELSAAKALGYVPVVLTHHAPASTETSAPCYDESPHKYAFSTDIHVAELPCVPRLWVFGHTHYNVHHKQHANGYELVSNQFGYDGEHDGLLYKFAKVLEILP